MGPKSLVKIRSVTTEILLQKIGFQKFGGVHQKITEDHDHKEEGACKRIDQTEGANKGNNYSQDYLSMGV